MKNLTRALSDVIRVARSGAAGRRAGRVNLAGRINTVVTGNVGGRGEGRSASATQTTRIVQDGSGTVEETQTRTATDGP